MTISLVVKIDARYVPFDFSNILGFPNTMLDEED